MLSFIVEVVLSVLLFRRKPSFVLVAGIAVVVAVVLVATIFKQADFVR
ncbi:MAG TPA: hypothetical protein VGD65_11250 [Chryseosolibacter sp.]